MSEAETPPNGTHENPQVVEIKDGVPANVIIRIFVIGFGLMLIVAIVIPLLIRWHDQESRINTVSNVALENRELAEQLGRTQKQLLLTQQQLKGFAAQQCIEAESRDVVNVQTNLAMITLLQSLMGSETPPVTRAKINTFIQSLRDANATLEPEGEKDCQPGPGDENP